MHIMETKCSAIFPILPPISQVSCLSSPSLPLLPHGTETVVKAREGAKAASRQRCHAGESRQRQASKGMVQKGRSREREKKRRVVVVVKGGTHASKIRYRQLACMPGLTPENVGAGASCCCRCCVSLMLCLNTVSIIREHLFCLSGS